MKILHLIDSGGLYGAESVVINLSRELERQQCRSLIGCFTYKGKRKPDIGTKAESLGLETIYFNLRNKFDLIRTTQIASFCRANGITLIHAHGYKASLYCLLLKLFFNIPYVITNHLWFSNDFSVWFYHLTERISMLFASNIIGVSQEIVDDLIKKGVPRRKVQLIDNGIDILSYSQNQVIDEINLRKELGLRQDSFIIGSLGRLTAQKDYKTFVQAAAEVLKSGRNIEFIIAGDGPLESELKSLTERLGIQKNFHFLGFRNDTIPILNLMDIFVLSSLDEGLPMAMLEAMAARRPVVSTRVGGIPKVISDGYNGMLINSEDFVQLKEKLLFLINNPEKSKLLGNLAYQTVFNNYSLGKMTNRYLKIYETSILI
jgi:glycosyltransferase involved in cell wall biosynthesis